MMEEPAPSALPQPDAPTESLKQDERKERILRPMARGDLSIAQAWSEPNSGTNGVGTCIDIRNIRHCQ